MTAKWCGLCNRRHYFQATPEVSAPRRESIKDFLLALLVWGLVIAAYVGMAVAAWVWSR